MADRQFVHKHDEVQLARLLRESKPLLDKYGMTIIYAVAAILAVAAVVVYFARRPPAGAESSRDLMLASTAEDYRDVADEAGGSILGHLARLKQAELTLNSAIGDLFANRAVGVEQLQTAEAAYNSLSKVPNLPKEARLRVLNGLARIAECRCDGSDETVNAAVAAWEAVLKEAGEKGIFKELAGKQIKELPTDRVRSFYAWFSKQNPAPADDENLPQDRPPANVPEIPSIDLGLPDLQTPSSETSTPGSSAESVRDPAAAPSETVPSADATSAPADESAAPVSEGTPAPATPADGPSAPADESAAPVSEGTPAPATPADGTPADGASDGLQEPAKDEPAKDVNEPESPAAGSPGE